MSDINVFFSMSYRGLVFH